MKKISCFEELSEGMKIVEEYYPGHFVNLIIGRFKDCGGAGYGYECFLDDGRRCSDLTRWAVNNAETTLWIDK